MRSWARACAAVLLLLPLGAWAGDPAGAAALPTCTTVTGTQTFTPGLTRVGTGTAATSTVVTTADIGGCAGGGVTSAKWRSTGRYGGTCKALLTAGATIAAGATITWNTGRRSTATTTLTELSPPGTSAPLLRLVSHVTAGMFAGTTSTVTIRATAPKGSCGRIPLSRYTFVNTSAFTDRPDPAGANCLAAGLPRTARYRTIPGVPADATSLDVYAPAGACNRPVVLWVHGGGFESGDKANQVADKITLFNGKGWLFASINYRLTVPGDPGSAHFPDHFDDVATAVAWVKSHIGRYGGDPSRIALLGHSSGADIVSNVADNPTYLAARGLKLSDLRCVGPLDTEGFDKATANNDSGERQFWIDALGNDPNYLTDTSPTSFVKAGVGIPPTIGVFRGTAVRQGIEKAYLAKLAAAGVRTTTIDARTLTHNEVNTRIGAPGDTVMTPPLVSFLTSCFAR